MKKREWEVNAFQIPNILVDEYISELSSHSFKLLVFIIRKTKGWGKKRDSISTTQLAEVLGLKKTRHVYPYVRELEDLDIIKVYKKQGRINQYTYHVPVTKKGSTKKGTSDEKGQYPVTKMGSGTSDEKGQSTKDTNKDTVNKEKNIGKGNLIDCFSADEKPLVQILIDHRQEIKKPLDTERATRMLIKKLNHYASEWNISLDDTLDFWLGEKWQSIDIEYKYPFRSRDKSKDNQPNKGTVEGMSNVKTQRIQMRINENKVRLAS